MIGPSVPGEYSDEDHLEFLRRQHEIHINQAVDAERLARHERAEARAIMAEIRALRTRMRK